MGIIWGKMTDDLVKYLEDLPWSEPETMEVRRREETLFLSHSLFAVVVETHVKSWERLGVSRCASSMKPSPSAFVNLPLFDETLAKDHDCKS